MLQTSLRIAYSPRRYESVFSVNNGPSALFTVADSSALLTGAGIQTLHRQLVTCVCCSVNEETLGLEDKGSATPTVWNYRSSNNTRRWSRQRHRSQTFSGCNFCIVVRYFRDNCQKMLSQRLNVLPKKPVGEKYI